MKEFLGEDAAFVLDIKQAVMAGENPVEMCRAMGTGLRHLHLNDFSLQNTCLLPGEGIMDYAAFFDQLNVQEFHGTAVIEVYRDSFDRPENLWDAKKFLDRMLQQKVEESY